MERVELLHMLLGFVGPSCFWLPGVDHCRDTRTTILPHIHGPA